MFSKEIFKHYRCDLPTSNGIRLFVSFLFVFFLHNVYAQDRCGTVEYTKDLKNKNLLWEREQHFEQWLQQKIEKSKERVKLQRTEDATYQVPVVVHIIHNGEAIGTGVNISDAQVLSQINVLNNDFKRLNADASNTPAEFLPVASSMDVEFVLAKRTPEGIATSGIVRVQGAKTQWSMNDNYQLKSTSYWPAEDYLNIWVTNLSGGLLGYAQFPVSPLPGMENSSNNRLTDGVAIDYTVFGSIDDGPFNLDAQYNKGRTTTHEVGHFFGLRHIWGDDEGACSGTDYVDDTPNQSSNTNNCPTHPRTTCSTTSMFQNYLDYTNDVCMNIFTQGQVDRMVIVIENSPRRASLLTSPGLEDPAPLANDLGIKEIITPAPSECTTSVVPSLEIRNYGNNLVTHSRITVKRNTILLETKDFALNLNPLQSEIVTFSPQTLSSGNNDFAFEIIQTNNGADGNTGDNIRSVTSSVPNFITLPFSENFNTTPSGWIINNPDQLITWTNVEAPREVSSNQAMFIDFYNYEDNIGEIDMLTTPVFDLSATTSPFLIFDVSHARFQSDPSNDGLRVIVLTACNTDLFDGTEVYNKSGSTLATAPSTNIAFIPNGISQWRKEIIDLSAFAGESEVQLAFIGMNDYGNNLYIDNISVVTSNLEDLAIKEIISPSPVSCVNNPTPHLLVQNLGTSVITNFNVEYQINSGTVNTAPISGITIQPGNELEITLPALALQSGENILMFNLTEPNGLIDANTANSLMVTHTIVSTAKDKIPLRENFNTAFDDQWTIINPFDGMPWETVNTNFNQSLYFNGFDNTAGGDEAWLVSPVLDFSETQKASMFFDLSYAVNNGINDRIVILGSTDCGNSFDRIILDRSGSNISNNNSSSSWLPATSDDWTKEYVNLNTFAGEKTARIAFVFINANGNNLYLDNIEFFASDDPSPPTVDKIFTIYNAHPDEDGHFHVSFNLPERQAVGYQVVDMMGRLIVDALIGDVLNQTYLINLKDAGTGVYIVRLNISGQYYASKIFVQR